MRRRMEEVYIECGPTARAAEEEKIRKQSAKTRRKEPG